MSKQSLQLEIDRLENEISELEQQLLKFKQKLASIKSREFIEKHNITLVEQCGDRFKNFLELRLHIGRSQITKPWVEWKGRIYYIEDIQNGINKPTPALLEDWRKARK